MVLKSTWASGEVLTAVDLNAVATDVNTLSNAVSFVSVATANGTTTLNVASAGVQAFTGTANQTVVLPTTSVLAGERHRIINNSTGTVTVQSSDLTTVTVLATNTSGLFIALVATPTTPTHWDAQYFAGKYANGKAVNFNNSLTLAGTDGTTVTFPATNATLARTDAAQTFTGVQTMTSPALTTPVITGIPTGTGVASTNTGNTLALRTAEGYIFGSYFNMNHAATTRSTDTIFYSSTDDYLRKNNATGFKTSLALNNVDNTSDATKNAATATLTNKRVNPRVVSVASSATPAINTDTGDVFNLTSLATNVTSMTTSLTGTPIDGQRMTIRVKSADAQTITWGASFVSSGAAMLPTTTVAGATHRLDFLWDAADSDWVCVGSFHKTYSSPPTRMGSGITVNRTATGLASLSTGENIFPLGWFGNVVRSTDDLTYDTSGTNTGKVTVSVEGWYQCTLSCAAGLASANGGVLYSILWTGSGAGARSVAFYGGQSRYNAAGGTAPSLNGSFIIYLQAGDYVEPGYYSNVAVSNTLGNTSSDFTSKTTWFSVALINRSHS